MKERVKSDAPQKGIDSEIQRRARCRNAPKKV